jgi:hypothetical protein
MTANCVAADFSMRSIEILQPQDRRSDVSIDLDHKPCGGCSVKSEYSSLMTPSYCQEDPGAPSSRLLDEKVSDDSGTEAKTNSALAPAGLKNPFWK